MRKKLIHLLTAMMLVVSVNGVLVLPVHASPSINDVESSVQMLDNEIQNNMISLNKLNKQIEDKQNKITDTEKKIADNQKKYNKEQDAFYNRLKHIYINGGFKAQTIEYVDAIASGGSIFDIIERINCISFIVKGDKENLNNIENERQELNKEKDSVKKDEQILGAKKSEIENELKDMNTSKQAQVILLTQLKTLSATQKAQQIAPIILSADTPANVQGVITEGEKYLGVQYVWGGTEPTGFDCSGLMQYIFAKQGIDLPRIASDQQNVGNLVSPNDIKPGDLVFFGYPAHHVGMYVGNGEFIEAPHTGDVVKISPLDLSSVSTIKRVLN